MPINRLRSFEGTWSESTLPRFNGDVDQARANGYYENVLRTTMMDAQTKMDQRIINWQHDNADLPNKEHIPRHLREMVKEVFNDMIYATFNVHDVFEAVGDLREDEMIARITGKSPKPRPNFRIDLSSREDVKCTCRCRECIRSRLPTTPKPASESDTSGEQCDSGN